MRILLAVDGSKAALGAVKRVIDHVGEFRDAPTIDLVTVHRPIPKVRGMGAGVGKSQVERYYQDEGEKALAEAKKLLDKAGIPYHAQVLVGDPAEAIMQQCRKARCNLVALGAKGRSAFGDMLLGSTASKVIQISEVPVLLVK
jgi:nucleotide-binding universal stress UspA family protein